MVAELKKACWPSQSLKSMPDAGYIERRASNHPSYAYVRPTGGGRIVTVVAPTPIVFLGAGVPGATSKAGFDLSLALLDVKDATTGTGELAPAATAKVNDTGGIETKDYGSDVIKLMNVRIKP